MTIIELFFFFTEMGDLELDSGRDTDAAFEKRVSEREFLKEREGLERRREDFDEVVPAGAFAIAMENEDSVSTQQNSDSGF